MCLYIQEIFILQKILQRWRSGTDVEIRTSLIPRLKRGTVALFHCPIGTTVPRSPLREGRSRRAHPRDPEPGLGRQRRWQRLLVLCSWTVIEKLLAEKRSIKCRYQPLKLCSVERELARLSIKEQKKPKPSSTLLSPPSPPIPIKGQKTKPVTPDIEKDQKGFVNYPLTLGSALLEKAQRKQESSRRDRANDITARLEAIEGTKARLNALTEDVLMELRASIDTNLPLNFQVIRNRS